MFQKYFWILVFLKVTLEFCEASKDHENETRPYLKSITIVSEEREGLRRLLRSAALYDIDIKVLGIGEWVLPKNLQTFLIRNDGLWQKITILTREIEQYKDDEKAVILMVDGFDVIFCAGEEEILSKFLELKANVLFGAEVQGYERFLESDERYKHINSGMILAYASVLYKLLTTYKRNETALNDQIYLNSLFLNDEIRRAYNIKLDYRAKVVQNLFYSEDDMEIEYSKDDARLVNKIFGTKPPIIHGNGYLGMMAINSFGNYIAKSWNPIRGCMACNEGRIDLDQILTWDYPKVLMGIFIVEWTPFLEEMLARVVNQQYPKQRIYLYVINHIQDHEVTLREWVRAHERAYFSIKYIPPSASNTVEGAKQDALDLCLQINCDVFFNVEGIVQLENPNTLLLLISYNRTLIAPIMSPATKLWSTFWGGIDGRSYKRSSDYVDIVIGNKRGIWNVPCIKFAYLVWRSAIENPLAQLSYVGFRGSPIQNGEAIMFCLNNLANETFMYGVNLEDYGHLTMTFEEKAHYQNELWHVQDNSKDWRRRYILQEYTPRFYKKVIKDVFTFPVLTQRFCEELKMALPAKFLNDRNQTYLPLEDLKFKDEWNEIFWNYITPTVEILLKGKEVSKFLRKSFIHKYEPGNQFDMENHHFPYLRIALTENSIKAKKEQCQTCSFPDIPVGWVTVYLRHKPCANGESSLNQPCINRESSLSHQPCASKESSLSHQPCANKESFLSHHSNSNSESFLSHQTSSNRESSLIHQPSTNRESSHLEMISLIDIN